MSDTLTIGTVQFTRKLGDKKYNIKRASEFVRIAADKGAKIISLPEMFSTGCFMSGEVSNEYFQWAEPIPGPTVAEMEQLAKELNVYLIAPIYEIDSKSLVYYNSAPVISPTDGTIGKMRKRHIPSGAHMIEKYYYAPGNIKYPVFKAAGWNIAVSICYDRHFPETFRLSALHGAQIVFSVNNTPTARSLKMWFIEILAASSSSGIFIVQNNAVGEEHGFFGKSFIAGPEGDIISRLYSEEEVLVQQISKADIEKARLHYKSIWDTNWSDFGMTNEQ